MWVCSSGSEGVAVGGSDHHGGGVLGSDSYSGSHRLVYCGRSMAGNYSLSELWGTMARFKHGMSCAMIL